MIIYYVPTATVVYAHQMLINAIQAGRPDDAALLARMLAHAMKAEREQAEFSQTGRY